MPGPVNPPTGDAVAPRPSGTHILDDVGDDHDDDDDDDDGNGGDEAMELVPAPQSNLVLPAGDPIPGSSTGDFQNDDNHDVEMTGTEPTASSSTGPSNPEIAAGAALSTQEPAKGIVFADFLGPSSSPHPVLGGNQDTMMEDAERDSVERSLNTVISEAHPMLSQPQAQSHEVSTALTV